MENILIFNPKIARLLIKNGQTVVDIKPQKENSDKTIFIFKKTDDLFNIIESHK